MLRNIIVCSFNIIAYVGILRVKKQYLYLVILVVFGIVLFFLNIGRWDLWNPDEPRYAQVAKEMVNRGDWILMHVNGRMYEDKPPLFFWVIALSSYIWQGFTSFSVRFPSALFGTLTVLLTFFLGKRVFGSRTGFLSALILATSFEFAYLSTRANIDATLTFFTTGSIFCFLQWYWWTKQGKQEQGDIRRLSIYGFYLGMALATLTKGPVGFILPLLVSLTYLVIQKDWKGLKGMKVLPGMLLMIAIVSAWYFPAILKGGKAFLEETLLQHTIDRFAKGTSHVRPFYYYFYNFPVDYLPWTLFLPGAIVFGFSKKEEGRKEFLFFLVWFISIFLFFSFSKGKRAIYLLPLYPAVSLLVGNLWDTYLSGSLRDSISRVWIRLPIYFFIALLGMIGTVLLCIPTVANFPLEVSTSNLFGVVVKAARIGNNYLSYIPRESVVPLIFLFLGLSLLLSIAHGFKFRFIVFMLFVATVGVGFFYGTRVIFPLVNPYKSARFISQEIQQMIQPGDKLVMYGDYGSAGTAPYNFYTGIVPILEIETEEEIIDFFHSDENIFCLLKYHDYENLRRKHPNIPLRLITQRQVGDRKMVLISNQ